MDSLNQISRLVGGALTYERTPAAIAADAAALVQRIQDDTSGYYASGKHVELLGHKSEARVFEDALAAIGYIGHLKKSRHTESGYPELTIMKAKQRRE